MSPSKTDQQVQVPVTAERALAAYPDMIMAIPEAEFDSDGSEILADILMATRPEQLNDSATSLPDAEKMVGRTILVTTIGRMKSDLKDGLGWYLLVEFTEPSTGEAGKFQTSSSSVMAKLVKLHLFGALPAEVKITRAEKPTRAGYYPCDLYVKEWTRR